ncbi:EAL domain-containing protein [Marinobacter litoralis]|uniref:EAL domain-containing protein n=1 Tax=Marinobacter litoralis TaxID=187981 RepID=UPI0018EBBFDF|nr:EAL domain-containing protein [Marinobacter litoralis]MBJ6136578.1 EAL domain-containing protein [Marinobacter litoralis]
MTDTPSSLRILLIEDDEDDVLITRDLLEEGSTLPVELDWVDNAPEGLEALREHRHDIALVDYRLGPELGVELIRQARNEAINTPMILLTGQGDSDLDARAVEIGAADYLVKGMVDAASMMRSIRYAIYRSVATAKLEQSEARHRVMFDHNPAAMMLVEPESGELVSLNEAARNLYGISDVKAPPPRLDQLIADQETYASSLTRVEGLLTSTSGSLEVHRCREGAELYVEVQRQPVVVGSRELELIMVVDVTDRVEKSRELRLMKQAIESSFNGILIADARQPDMPLVFVNTAFERITGYRSEESIGRNCRFLQQSNNVGSDQVNADALINIREALRATQPVSEVLRNYRKDGTPFWNDLYIAPICDSDGTLTHFVGIQNDISQQKTAESKLAYNASHDVLTGLPNRTLLQDRLTQACQVAARYGRKVGVLFFDLDGFKPINDSLGHQVGDQLLMQVATRIEAGVRSGDTVARSSGDEFIVVLPDLAHGNDVIGVVEELLSAIAEPYEIESHQLHLTASVGIALDDGEIHDPMSLVQQADLAMYRAKQAGRNTYHWYASDLNEEANERVELRNELQKSLDHAGNGLELFYQPIIDGRTGNIRGSEALIRWRHSARGLMPPIQFMPLAEDTGQIIRLGEWVLRQACKDAVRLQGMGYREHKISVNVSPLQLRQPGFVEMVKQILQQTGLSPMLLELEIVESAVLRDTDQVVERLHQLRKMGLGIAIDDFGTGFSSLSYLKVLPATKIKIDRSFVKEVISNRNDAAITQGILIMARSLSLEVVAEGVETEAHAAFLRKHSCDLLQGYLFARPMPFEELSAFLARQNRSFQGENDESDKPTLLLLDDEANILRAMTRILRRDGYRILSTTSVQEAFEMLAANNVQVIVSDQRMPEMSGTEFLSQVKDIYPNTVRIVLSGYTDLRSVTDAINEGAIYKFLTKPWDDQQIRDHIKRAFLYHGAIFK